jgi:hypothetical protein
VHPVVDELGVALVGRTRRPRRPFSSEGHLAHHFCSLLSGVLTRGDAGGQALGVKVTRGHRAVVPCVARIAGRSAPACPMRGRPARIHRRRDASSIGRRRVGGQLDPHWSDLGSRSRLGTRRSAFARRGSPPSTPATLRGGRRHDHAGHRLPLRRPLQCWQTATVVVPSPAAALARRPGRPSWKQQRAPRLLGQRAERGRRAAGSRNATLSRRRAVVGGRPACPSRHGRAPTCRRPAAAARLNRTNSRRRGGSGLA